jgi:hypothetical protein
MDAYKTSADWPKLPYRGLDFYREKDACLFRERDEDVRRCEAMLLGYGVKILILQGSSGSGKSSFLRAGLIPYLKRDRQHRSFLLNSRDSVIRCTADPLPEIANALRTALNSKEVFAGSGCHKCGCEEDTLLEEAVCSAVCHDLEIAIGGSRKQLGDSVAKALVAICGDLPGKLILVLDQAEEVLTRTLGTSATDEASAAFFRFLETVYLRNIDVRILVSLRTEYYGRFRDELKISDDRLSDRPKSGGVEPYLLRPLREKTALIGVVEFPTKARKTDGTLAYNFAFQDGLVERLVDDLLTKLPHASLTPALQVVCASLFELLTDKDRTITHQHYNSQNELDGIMYSYVRRGLGVIGVKMEGEVDKWHSLLYELVSRQGGGTVVSLSETSETLAQQAKDLHIEGDVESALRKLAGGHTPLLRGEPPEDSREFSLKHDVLAVMLSQWHEQYEGARIAREEARKAKEEARKIKEEEVLKRKKLNWTIVAGFFVFVAMASAVVVSRDQTLFEEKCKRIELTNQFAQRSRTGDFRQSLLLLAATFDATARPNMYERLSRALKPIHNDSVKALRSVFARAPRFLFEEVQATGLNPDGRHLAVLRNDSLEVLTLPSGDDVQEIPEIKKYPLAVKSGVPNLKLGPAVGFVDGLGPAAFVNGYVYFWDEQGEQLDRNIWDGVLASNKSANWFRVEFISGALQVTSVENRQKDRVTVIKALRLDEAKLKANPQEFPLASEVASLEIRMPGPVFSNNPRIPELYAYLDETSQSKTLEPQWDLQFGTVDRGGDGPYHDPVPARAPGAPARRPTLTFLANIDAVLVKEDDWELEIYYDLTSVRSEKPDGEVDLPRKHIAVEPRLQTETVPTTIGSWLYPPLAATQVSKHIRAAWLDADGVLVVESKDEDPGRATQFTDGNLLSGDPGGTKLQFTPNGDFLILLQQRLPTPTNPVSIRIWDLRQAWQNWIHNADDEALLEAACHLVRPEGKENDLSQHQMELLDQFQFDKANRGFCMERKAQK